MQSQCLTYWQIHTVAGREDSYRQFFKCQLSSNSLATPVVCCGSRRYNQRCIVPNRSAVNTRQNSKRWAGEIVLRVDAAMLLRHRSTAATAKLTQHRTCDETQLMNSAPKSSAQHTLVTYQFRSCCKLISGFVNVRCCYCFLFFKVCLMSRTDVVFDGVDTFVFLLHTEQIVLFFCLLTENFVCHCLRHWQHKQ